MEEYYFHLRMSEYVFSIASILIGIVFLLTRGPKAARLALKVLAVMIIVLLIGFGFFWPYKITLSKEGITTNCFFKKKTIKYSEIDKLQITRNASRGGRLRANYLSGSTEEVNAIATHGKNSDYCSKRNHCWNLKYILVYLIIGGGRA